MPSPGPPALFTQLLTLMPLMDSGVQSAVLSRSFRLSRSASSRITLLALRLCPLSKIITHTSRSS